ncbi:hypothetical protein [Bacillus sp. SH8-8]|uniref:hypothetical protein n=1 Tax=Bacillus sp. SH8-8 TaxID=2217830 RepID=UPI0034D43DEB
MGVSLYHVQGETTVIWSEKVTPFTVAVAVSVIFPGPKAVTLALKDPSACVNTIVGETVAAPVMEREIGIPANPISLINKRPVATTGTLQSPLVKTSPRANETPVIGILLIQTLMISFSLNLKATRNPSINPKFCS